MKTALLSLATALTLFVATAASAAPAADHNDPRRMSPIERSRYEAAQRENDRRQALERARYEAAQRKLQQQQDRKLAQERARIEAQRRAQQQRWDAQHRHDYGYNHR